MAPPVSPLPPIVRSVSVSWDPAAAFERFTAQFASWWPTASHSIGGDQVKRVIFECRVGGRIIEELKDGRRFLWGQLTAWDPPRRVAFTWHPSMEESDAQDVEVRFQPEGTGTLVTLTSSGWERLGEKARRARRGYELGWGSLLDYFGGRKTFTFRVFGAMSAGQRLFLKLTGRLEAEIDKSGGRLAPG